MSHDRKDQLVLPCIEEPGLAGDVWTWVALDADTKLVPSYLVGGHGPSEAHRFMTDVAGRMANRMQLSSDGNKLYLTAVERAFGSEIDYAMIVKVYENTPSGYYSPPECIGTERTVVMGDPDDDHISTSYVERQNLDHADEHAPVRPADQRVLPRRSRT